MFECNNLFDSIDTAKETENISVNISQFKKKYLRDVWKLDVVPELIEYFFHGNLYYVYTKI